ncbi:MAG: hypothetical protein ACRERE_14900 [Candidatus Entotheonellia bacterium]
MIRVLSHRMKWVGSFQIVSGIGVLIAAIASFARAQEGFALLSTGVVLLVIGIYTSSASKSFSEISETVRADITHLMEVVRTLKGLYNIQSWLIIAYLVIIALIILAVIFRVFSGS